MKKIIFVLAAGMAAFTGLQSAGCGKAGTPAETQHTSADTTATKADDNEAAAGKIIHLTKADFLKKVVNYEKDTEEWNYLGQQPAIIDFYADWCGPCRQLSPVLEQLAAEYKGKIIVYKINVDKEQELAAAFGISGLPTLLFIPMQGAPQSLMGLQPKEELTKMIDGTLLGKQK